MIRKRHTALLVALALLQAIAPARAQPAGGTPAAPTATAAPVTASKPAYDLRGFRSARFGMTEAEVRTAIQKDFPVKPDQIRQTTNGVERTTALVVSLPTLEPGPGPATAIYILGYKSKKLIQVNVVWSRETKADEKTDAGPYFLAGVQLANYFGAFDWGVGRVNLGVPVGPATLLLFGAEHDKTGAVQVVVDGIKLERKPDGRVEAQPEAQGGGPVSLRVSYIVDRTSPDIFRLEPGRV
jgi:hypothetical protein